jgi:hypothetical protein
MSLKNLAWLRKTKNKFEFSVKILFSSPTLVLVTERKYFFVNQCNCRPTFHSPWWWRQHVPLKRRSTIILHGSTSQKTILIFILAAVRTWNLTCSLGLYQHTVVPRAWQDITRQRTEHKNFVITIQNATTLQGSQLLWSHTTSNYYRDKIQFDTKSVYDYSS